MGRSRSSARGRLAECRHLEIGRLTADRLAGVLDLTLIGLPGLADDVLVGSNGTLGRHAQGVRLKAHVGGELALALGIAVETDRAVEILVADVVGELGRGVFRLGDGLGVELACPVGGADIEPTILCRWICIALSESPSERLSAPSIRLRWWKSRMPSLSRTGRPKLSEMRAAWLPSGQQSRTISRVVPLRSGTTRALDLGERVELDIELTFLAMPSR